MLPSYPRLVAPQDPLPLLRLPVDMLTSPGKAQVLMELGEMWLGSGDGRVYPLVVKARRITYSNTLYASKGPYAS